MKTSETLTTTRKIAMGYAVVLAAVTSLNFVPGLTDDAGRVFGIFELDVYDDLLHGASAAWAGIAAFLSHRAARAFLVYFGAIYLADGLLGVATGSGFLDLGIFVWGIQDLDLLFRFLASAPHLLLGGIALAAGLMARREA